MTENLERDLDSVLLEDEDEEDVDDEDSCDDCGCMCDSCRVSGDCQHEDGCDECGCIPG